MNYKALTTVFGCVALMGFGSLCMGYNIYQLQLDNMDILIDEYSLNKEEVLRLQDKVKERDKVILEMQSNETELLEKLDLITSFGITDRLSVENIRDMLDLAEQVPYGSPFASGHWVSSKFGLRDESQINGNDYTEGIDLVGKNGDRQVRTTADGKIIDYGFSDTYGRYIIVDHNNGFRTQYSHLSKIYWQDKVNKVVIGVPIVKGDIIGVMGNTGICWSDNGGDGSHLDYRISLHDLEEDVWVKLNPTQCLRYSGGDKK